MTEKINIKSPIQISEVDNDKPYIVLTTRLCYLDYLNLNNVGLSSKATDSFNTLIDMPIVAKINKKGNKFGSHEVTIKDDELSFGTSAYGTHIEVYVEDDEVDIPKIGKKTVPCLFAKSKVWKRFKNVVELIENKINNPEKYNGGLFSSWELEGRKWHEEQGGKMYDKFVFLANTLIDVPPAYGKNSKTLAIASKEDNNSDDFNELLCSALLQDLKELEKLATSSIEDVKNNKNINNQGGIKIMGEKNNETASLTINDLYQKIAEQLNPKGWASNPYYSIWAAYPEEHKVLCQNIEGSQDQLMVFTYSVDENDNLNLGEGQEKKLSALLSEMMNVNISMNLDDTAKLLSEKETKIKELETEVSTTKEELDKVNSELSEKVEAITKLGEKVTEKDSLIAELTPLKEAHDKMIAEQEAQELAEKQESLKALATKGGYITSEELETSEELKAMIESLDEKGVKAEIASRVIAKLDEQKPEVETSGVENKSTKTDLNNSDEGLFSATDIIKSILKRK